MKSMKTKKWFVISVILIAGTCFVGVYLAGGKAPVPKVDVDAIRLRPHPWEFALYFDI